MRRLGAEGAKAAAAAVLDGSSSALDKWFGCISKEDRLASITSRSIAHTIASPEIKSKASLSRPSAAWEINQ